MGATLLKNFFLITQIGLHASQLKILGGQCYLSHNAIKEYRVNELGADLA